MEVNDTTKWKYDIKLIKLNKEVHEDIAANDLSVCQKIKNKKRKRIAKSRKIIWNEITTSIWHTVLGV